MTETPLGTIAATEDDETISTGDVVVDLASGSPLQVIGRSTQTASEHPQTRSDATTEMFGADGDERVYHCVFLPESDDRISPPSKTYAYPESRLLRYPVEAATDIAGIQTHVRVAVLNDLVEAAVEGSAENPEHSLAVLHDLVYHAYSEDVADLVDELADSMELGDPA